MEETHVEDRGERRRFPTWALALIGCGALSLLAIGSCAGLGFWGVSKARDFARGDWERLMMVAKELASDDGAERLYRRSPALADTYPSAESFLAAVHAWRSRLADVPAEPPSLLSGRMQYSAQINPGHKSTTLGYRFDDGTWLTTRWEGDQLLEVHVR